jgi:hypothetical protein
VVGVVSVIVPAEVAPRPIHTLAEDSVPVGANVLLTSVQVAPHPETAVMFVVA